MKNCPNCGALINEGQSTCSLCNAQLVDNNDERTKFFNGIFYDQEKRINKVYEPLPERKEEVDNKEQEKTTNVNNTSDEDKKNVMSNILKEHEEANNKPKKDDSFKAALLSIIVVIIIVAGGYYAVKLGFNDIDDGKSRILDQVKEQANNYTTIVKDYMRKYDYYSKKISLNGYYAKKRTINFLTLPVTGKCILKDGKWIGADEDEVSCQKFFYEINNNYCSSVPCSIPNEAEIYIKETYETVNINGNDETITTGTILDGTILTFDDVKCSLSNNSYTCEYIEKEKQD